MKLSIKKFKAIENLEMSIPAHVSGGNGLGKSTILEAVSYVLTGKNLDGKEFEQVYDNRADIHDAIADVSYFDDYGNEFQRIVKPVFQTNRAGVEEIKIKRSTECRKNGIAVNDFSDEFQDFFKFGTDYFFVQKEDVQRSIFIDVLKSKLPNYDVNASSLKLKELKRSQKIEVDQVKSLQDANKNTKDILVPVIDQELERMNLTYLSFRNSSNPDAVSEINKRNNALMLAHFTKKTNIQNDIVRNEIAIARAKEAIKSETEKLEALKKSVFEPKKIESTEWLTTEMCKKRDDLKIAGYYTSIEEYAAKNFTKNPVLIENAAKIERISKREFVLSFEPKSNCPLTNQFCEIAKGKAAEAEAIVFKNNKDAEISTLRAQNRTILEKEMNGINSEYNAVKSDLSEVERKLNNLIIGNQGIESSNEIQKGIFEASKLSEIEKFNTNIEFFNKGLIPLKSDLDIFKANLSNLVEPTPEKLPESIEISEELKEAHATLELLKIDINKAEGVNENNKKLISERSKEIKEKQANLLEIIEQISTLTTEISDYFNNLKGIVSQEFSGDIEISVELLEYVMSRDEYKDCFKITANGKVFPYECNGALQNNVKMQILFNLQRLKGYKGVTVMDNCEANTSQPINTLGLNCVLSFATFDKELIIK